MRRIPTAATTTAVIVTALLVAVACDLALGQGVSPGRVPAALLDPSSLDGRILWLVRAPRLATAMLAGAAAGVAGVVLQAVLRNPLASPDTAGINAAAVLGVVVVIAFALVPSDSSTGFAAAALIGGLAGGGSAYLLAGRLGAQRQLLVGMLVAAAMGGGITLFLALRMSRFASVLRWLVGSVDGRVWTDLAWVAAWVLAGSLLLGLAGGLLPILAAGDDHARAVGVHPAKARAVLLTGATAVACGAAAVAGAITFIGLVVPHLVRRTGLHHRWWIPAAAVVGATLLVGCDALAQALTTVLLAREVSQRAGIPAGAVAAVVGAGALIFLLRRSPSS